MISYVIKLSQTIQSNSDEGERDKYQGILIINTKYIRSI